MTEIRFTWDPEKAIQAAAYLVQRLERVDKVKLTKLLYLADREHFLQHGAPITGDEQYAMPKGPVPSKTLHLLDGEVVESGKLFQHLHQDDFTWTLRLDPGTGALAASEIAVLDAVLREHGQKDKWLLVNELHHSPEYVEVYREGTSTRIPYETILQHYETGDGSRFRRGRPVVSSETMAAMRRPFPGWT